jgi:hypothetical protein
MKTRFVLWSAALAIILAAPSAAVVLECKGTANYADTNGFGERETGSMNFKGTYETGAYNFLVNADGGKVWKFDMETLDRSYKGDRVTLSRTTGAVNTYNIEIDRMTGEVTLTARMTKKPTVIRGAFDYRIDGTGQCTDVSTMKPKF